MDTSTFKKYIVPGEDGIAQIQILKSDGDGAVAMCGKNSMLPLSSKAELTALLVEAAQSAADVVIAFLDDPNTKTLDSVVFAVGVAQAAKTASPVDSMLADYEDDEIAEAMQIIRMLKKPGTAGSGLNIFAGLNKPKRWPETIAYEDESARTQPVGDITSNALPQSQNNGGQYRNGDQKKNKHFHDSTSNRQNGNGTHTLK